MRKERKKDIIGIVLCVVRTGTARQTQIKDTNIGFVQKIDLQLIIFNSNISIRPW